MAVPMPDLVLRGGLPWGHPGPADVLVRDGVIVRIGPDPDAAGVEVPGGAAVLDVAGRLVLPGLVDAHAHVNKTRFGRPWEPHSARDSLADRIAAERRDRDRLGVPDVDAMVALLERMVGSGTAHVRTHTDVDAHVGLTHVAAVREAVRRMDGRITVTQVAFPQAGLFAEPGTVEVLEQALAEGVEAIGGIDPAGVDGDPVRHLDIVFGLAERYGARIDTHLTDGGTLGAWQLALIAERTAATGLRGRVAVSHAYALAQIDAGHLDRLAALLADAGVTVTTAAVYGYPVPPLHILRAAGVNVALGNDGVRDAWGPYGTGDMLDRAMHLAYRSAFRRDEDIELALLAATTGGATALGLSGYGLAAGSAADLVVVAAASAAEAVVTRPTRDLVLKAGRVVARAGAPV
jgi:cytosine/creatinine deaminase